MHHPIHQSRVEPLRNLGLLHLAAGRYESSIEYFENAIDQLPGNINARNNMAVALIRLKRLEEARKQLQLLIHIQPAMPAAYFAATGAAAFNIAASRSMPSLS